MPEDSSTHSMIPKIAILTKGPFAITNYSPLWSKGVIQVDPSINIFDFEKYFDPYGSFYPKKEIYLDSVLFSGFNISPPKVSRIGRSRGRISKSESPQAILYLSQKDKIHGSMIECLGGRITSDSLQLVFYDKQVGTFFINGFISTYKKTYPNNSQSIERMLTASISLWQGSKMVLQDSTDFYHSSRFN